MRGLSSLRGASLFVCAFSAVFYLLGAVLLRRWLGCSRPTGFAASEPVTFLRPIKTGEPHLEDDLRLFLSGIEPGDQVVFGTSSERDALLCRRLIEDFCLPDAICIECLPGLHENPKVNKLAQMEGFARHPLWIILDSDTCPDRAFLTTFRSEWTSCGADAVSAPYAFARDGGLASLLDAAGTSLSLWPGVALLRAAGRVDFLTGACMGVPARFVQAGGGWKCLGSRLADDFELGRLIRAAGGTIGITSVCISIRTGTITWQEWISHQHRAFATYRLCNPWGSLGIPLTHGVAVSFVLLLGHPASAIRWLLHAQLLLLRTRCLRACPRPTTGQGPVIAWLVSLAEPFFWASSLLLPCVRWGEQWIRPKR